VALSRAAAVVAAAVASGALAAGADGAPAVRRVEIGFSLDAAHRLVVRYRAPADVAHLDFADADPRVDRLFRVPRMKAVDDCGALVPGGVDLRHGPGCGAGVAFVVEPGLLRLGAFYEPAQASSDGGVLFHQRYYAATAPGLAVRWSFLPEPGGYVVDEGRRHDAPAAREAGAPREALAEARLQALDALDYVFIGHAPTASDDGVLWVRDPALPEAVVAPVAEAARLAWQGYASAAQASPAGPVAIVMLAAPARGEGGGFHGDRSEGRMLRLSFEAPPSAPGEAEVEEWRHFAAHEIAHLWNHGVFSSDQDRPWLREGDAEWASLNLLHDTHRLSDAGFTGRLESAINLCLLARGERPAASLPPGPEGDDPYACGIALEFLGWAELRRRDPAAIDTPLERWGELHRRFPELGPEGFGAFHDGAKSTLMRELLQDDGTPFASTYRRDLAGLVLFQSPAGEPAGTLREGFAARLAARLVRADCGRVGFTPGADGVTLDADLRCARLPAGARITAVAGEPLAQRPRAAWAAAHRACADGKPLEVRLEGGRAVALACPSDLPEAPAWIRLADDTLRRLRLQARPVYAAQPPAAPLAVAASGPD
jgi:hypothetical protein